MGSAHPPPNWPCSIQLQSGSGQGHHCGRSTWCLPNGLPSVSPMQGWWWFVYTALVPPRWPRLHRILTRGSIFFARGRIAGSSPAMTLIRSFGAPSGETGFSAPHDGVEHDRHGGEHANQSQQLGGIEILGEQGGEIADAGDRHIELSQQH